MTKFNDNFHCLTANYDFHKLPLENHSLTLGEVTYHSPWTKVDKSIHNKKGIFSQNWLDGTIQQLVIAVIIINFMP